MPRRKGSGAFGFLVLIFLMIGSVVLVSSALNQGLLEVNIDGKQQDSLLYEVDSDWANRGILNGGMDTNSDLIFPKTDSSGSWLGDIKEMDGNFTGTFTGEGDARDGFGTYRIKLYESNPTTSLDQAKVTISNTTRHDDYSGVTTVSFDHGVSGNNTLLIVQFSVSDAQAGDGASYVSYGGKNLTNLHSIDNGRHTQEVWYLSDASTGVNTVTAEFTDTDKKTFRATSFTGVDTSDPIRDDVLMKGSSASFSNTVVVENGNDLVLDAVSGQHKFSPDSSQTQYFDQGIDQSDSDRKFQGSYKRGKDTVEMNWSRTSDSDWIHSVYSVQAFEEVNKSKPDEVLAFSLETGTMTESVDFSGYDFFEVEIDMTENLKTDNRRPSVDKIELDLESTKERQGIFDNKLTQSIIIVMIAVILFVSVSAAGRGW